MILANLYQSQSMIIHSLQSSLSDWSELAISSLKKSINILDDNSEKIQSSKSEYLKTLSSIVYNISSKLFKSKRLDLSLKFILLMTEMDLEDFDSNSEASKKAELIGAVYYDLKKYTTSSYWLGKSLVFLLKDYIYHSGSNNLSNFMKNYPTETKFWMNYGEKGKINKIDNIFNFHTNMISMNPSLGSPTYLDQMKISSISGLWNEEKTKNNKVGNPSELVLMKAVMDEIQCFYLAKQNTSNFLQKELLLSAIRKYNSLSRKFNLDSESSRLRCMVDLSKLELICQNLIPSQSLLKKCILEFHNPENWYLKYQLVRIKLLSIYSAIKNSEILQLINEALQQSESISHHFQNHQIEIILKELLDVGDFLSSKNLIQLEILILEYGHKLSSSLNIDWYGSLLLVMAYIKSFNIESASLLVQHLILKKSYKSLKNERNDEAFKNTELVFLQVCEALTLIAKNEISRARDITSSLSSYYNKIEKSFDVNNPHFSLITSHALSKTLLLLGEINRSSDISLQSFKFIASIGSFYKKNLENFSENDSFNSDYESEDDTFSKEKDEDDKSFFKYTFSNNGFRLKQVSSFYILKRLLFKWFI
ncbi:hypothetical protein AYI68_g1427 [Smittium mucronatum]|uniref:Uncharacterized protein n=1 Tax=Smittium mucronatum TaxID=133383 RepID=A0A1R0H5E7_9FUNG|nr:hypothetical protein AYI68_g1427 [Smittium mucronatum]